MNNPKPGEWRADELSQNYIADYKPFNFVDGEGVRCSLYVSGCMFHCEGCYNQATWSFRYGTPYTKELEDKIMADLAQPRSDASWWGTFLEYDIFDSFAQTDSS